MQIRIVLLISAILLAACGQPATPQAGGSITPVFAFTDVAIGPNRMAIGLVRNGSPLNDPGAKVHLRFYNLDENSGQVKFEADTTYYGQGLPAAVYVAYPTFDKAGNWGVEVIPQLSGEAPASGSKLRLEVREQSSAPVIGQPAIATRTLTVKDVPDPAQLASGKVTDTSLYQISLDEALKSGRPTAILFATPAFCRTATCGPSVNVMQELQKTYGTNVNFIHVEVYHYPFAESVQLQSEAFQRATKENRAMTPEEQHAGFSAAMAAWDLPSEPWLFLIDPQGKIAARYEGGITREEVGPAIERLIAGKPIFQG